MKKILLLLMVASAGLLTSCYKAPENGIAKITIYDSNHFRVPLANVDLTGPTGSPIHDGGITDMHGEWVYEHDPALEVILNVYAWTNDATGLHEAHGIIRIVPGKTTEESFTLYP
jgi:hypothetical protein